LEQRPSLEQREPWPWPNQTRPACVLLTNFVIAPLAFLSGTFYSIERLPGAWNTAARLDPFFYMIDGFRYGFTGHAEAPLAIGYAIMVAGNLGLGAVCWALFKTGYRLRPRPDVMPGALVEQVS
jgi:ABC-type multidrug transport system permease subunit